jgi:hypothetical protein
LRSLLTKLPSSDFVSSLGKMQVNLLLRSLLTKLTAYFDKLSTSRGKLPIIKNS